MNFQSLLCFAILSMLKNKARGWESKTACYEDITRLQCQKDETLAIKNAHFSTSNFLDKSYEKSLIKCEYNSSESGESCQYNLRLDFNRKCSGKKFCRFRMSENAASFNCSKYGLMFVEYFCVQKNQINRFCGEKLEEREGFIQSPGYPVYYSSVVCNWTIQAKEGQKITLEVLDLSMKPISKSKDVHLKTSTYEQACDHYLRVMDSKRRAFHVCGKSNDKLIPLSIDSTSVSITMYSDALTTKRGFLLHYKVIGCARIEEPENGYVVHQDGKTALVMCCLDYVFEDSLDNRKKMECVDKYDWDEQDLICTHVDEVIIARNLSAGSLDQYRNKTICTGFDCSEYQQYLYNIVIPITIIVSLIVINAIIVAFLMILRRNQDYNLEEEESLHEAHINQQREPSTSITSAATSHG